MWYASIVVMWDTIVLLAGRPDAVSFVTRRTMWWINALNGRRSKLQLSSMEVLEGV
jgi:hypothetical protein